MRCRRPSKFVADADGDAAQAFFDPFLGATFLFADRPHAFGGAADPGELVAISGVGLARRAVAVENPHGYRWMRANFTSGGGTFGGVGSEKTEFFRFFCGSRLPAAIADRVKKRIPLPPLFAGIMNPAEVPASQSSHERPF